MVKGRELESLEGHVEQRITRKGTASEHLGTYLVTADKEYLLQRIGGNPFSDPTVHELTGKRIKCYGYVLDDILRFERWEESPGL